MARRCGRDAGRRRGHCHHVAYNVADIEPFLGALTDHARLAVVLVIPTKHPMSAWNNAWRRFWELDRPDGPTSDDFAAVLAEMDIEAERWDMPRPPLARHTEDPTALVASTLRRLCLGEDRAAEVADYLELHEPDWATVHSVFRWPGDATTDVVPWSSRPLRATVEPEGRILMADTTMSIKQAAADFLACRRIAVTGVSRTAGNHGSNVVYTRPARP